MKYKRPHATRRLLWHSARRTTTKQSPSAQVGAVFGRFAAMARSGGGLISLGLGALMLTLIGLLLANFVGQVMLSARLEGQRAALQAEVDQLRAES
ncbi:MAG: hypothetical protein HGA19_19335, partial [Oscillochloris sp.]|nr:hypothetical protein [Oscillochloris sp.]